MPKAKTTFFCQECGQESPKWLGKCPSCNSWNTFVEEVVEKSTKNSTDWQTSGNNKKRVNTPSPIKEITTKGEERSTSHDTELDRVLGGGIVPGAVTLIGGEPGIGKSTLMLQIALSLKDKKVLYVSGEESQQQIKMRADRMGNLSENCFVLTETGIAGIFKQVADLMPNVLIIDSIQTLHSDKVESSAGSISQVKQCTSELIKFA
ncbi:MAG: AAA family ATPase, partial [Cyclobacteriaceae bacterium]|nr:AAA family ATPase [Cyclobacteriaceae bacterium]